MINNTADNSKMLRRNVINVLGTRSSTISMSLEKRLMILPRGLDSKNVIGEWRMLVSNPLWRLRDAMTEPKLAKNKLVEQTPPETSQVHRIFQAHAVVVMSSWPQLMCCSSAQATYVLPLTNIRRTVSKEKRLQRDKLTWIWSNAKIQSVLPVNRNTFWRSVQQHQCHLFRNETFWFVH